MQFLAFFFRPVFCLTSFSLILFFSIRCCVWTMRRTSHDCALSKKQTVPQEIEFKIQKRLKALWMLLTCFELFIYFSKLHKPECEGKIHRMTHSHPSSRIKDARELHHHDIKKPLNVKNVEVLWEVIVIRFLCC